MALCYASLMTEGVQGLSDPMYCVNNYGHDPGSMKWCLAECHSMEPCTLTFRKICKDDPNQIPDCYKTYFATLDILIQYVKVE